MIIKLINMPFADVMIPSIALTQLKSVSEATFGDKIKLDIHYLNHDFADYLTLDRYRYISLSGNSNNSGLGDWFFAQAAQPHLPDNTREYLMRYGNLIGQEFLQNYGAFLQEKRRGLMAFLDRLIDEYGLADADMVGFTSMFMQNVANLAMARRIKRRNKNVITVMGGANCETPMGEEIVKNFEIVDYVFSGTSLISFPTLIRHVMNGTVQETESINGVFTKNNCRAVTLSKTKVLVTDKDTQEPIGPIGDELSINESIPLNYDSFLQSFDRFFKNFDIKPYLLFETSRGCWWGAKAHCTFCGLNGGGMSYRAMKSEIAVDMINGLIDRYGDRVKHFSSVDNIIPKEYIREVFPNIKRHPDITIFYEVRADLTAEEMQILSDAGVVEMQPGIEALNTGTLKIMKKGTSAFNNIRFLHNAVRYSIRPHWNLLVGFPGEDEAVYEKYCHDLPLLHHLPPPSGVFPVRFDRYSPYFMQADKYNLDLHPLDYYFFNYSLNEHTLSKMAFYFSDHNFEAEYIANTSKWISKLQDKLQGWKIQWANIGRGEFPKLYFFKEDDQDMVFDSRLNAARKILLQQHEKEILNNLDQRKNIVAVHTAMPHISPEYINKSIDRLKKLGLLFEENGSYMNLVFESEPFLKRLKIFH